MNQCYQLGMQHQTIEDNNKTIRNYSTTSFSAYTQFGHTSIGLVVMNLITDWARDAPKAAKAVIPKPDAK